MNSVLEKVDVDAVRAAFPETWTHVHNIDWLRVGWKLKLAGVNWNSLPDMAARCEKAGIIQRDGYTLRRTP